MGQSRPAKDGRRKPHESRPGHAFGHPWKARSQRQKTPSTKTPDPKTQKLEPKTLFDGDMAAICKGSWFWGGLVAK